MLWIYEASADGDFEMLTSEAVSEVLQGALTIGHEVQHEGPRLFIVNASGVRYAALTVL